MKNSSNSMFCLPLQIAKSLYKKWDSQILLTNQQSQIYAKTLQGNAKLQFKNGNIYQGNMHLGLLNGKGKFIWTNGIIYQGQFKNNKIQGKGKYIWPDGSTYTGQIKNGKKQGYGQYISKTQMATYIGQWVNSKRNGKGKIQYSNGSIYQGTFKDNLKNGFGKMTYSSGNYYEGNWIDDLKQGQGIMNWINTNQKYYGNWQNNKQNGYGTHVWLQGKGQFKILKNRYQGNWLDGKRQGYGTFFYSNGSKYEGYWQNNIKQGFGIFHQDNGEVKIGFYKADRLIKKQQILQALPPLIKTLDTSGQKQLKPLKQLKQIGQIKKKGVLMKTHKKVQDKSLVNSTSIGLLTNKQIPQIPQKQILEHMPLLKKIDVQQNPYIKYLDIEDFEVSESIQNFLLRSHSQIKNWYKLFSFTHNDNYSGMSLENFWRLLKQIRIMQNGCTVSIINRLFYQGWKSHFDLGSNYEKKFCFIKYYFPNRQYGFTNLQYIYHSAQLIQKQVDLCENKLPSQEIFSDLKNYPFNLTNLYLEKQKNIHNPNNVIMFRHFASLLIRLAKAKFSNSNDDLKSAIQKIFEKINHLTQSKDMANISTYKDGTKCLSFQNTSLKSGLAVSKVVLQWAKKLNQKLFNKLTQNFINQIGVIDKTIPLKRVMKILEKGNVLKQSFQKMIFLEKIQKYLDAKNYYFRKQMKSNSPIIISYVQKSQIFKPLMNYDINLHQFNELMYITLTKRLSNIRQQQEIKIKYAQIIDQLIQIHTELTLKPSFVGLKRKNKLTKKDKLKNIKLQEIQKQRLRLQQQKLAYLRKQQEQKQRQDMAMNDFNIHTQAYLQQQDDQFD